MKRLRGVVSVAIAVAPLSCGDPTLSGPGTASNPPVGITVNPPAGIVVSEAVTLPVQISAQRYFATVIASTVYVSAAPRTFLNGISASIRNVTRNSSAITMRIVNGGFDPVGITAEADDEVSLTILNADNTTKIFTIKVPPRIPPRVVRTSPSKGRTDVALNVQVEVVFTEPMDKSTITTSSVSLIRSGQRVTGSIRISDDALTATFVPNSPLDPKAEYNFVIGAEVRDLSGDAIGEQTNVEFTTADADLPTGLTSSQSVGLAFVRNGTIFAAVSSGEEPVALMTEASHPAWSPDGTRIAFTRPAGTSLRKWELCIASQNGSTRQCATGENDGVIVAGPTWSSDGTRVAFGVFTYSCPGGYCGQLGGYFSSLLILNTLTMQVTALNTPPVFSSASWSRDGRRIAFTVFGGVLATVNADGSGYRVLGMSRDGYSEYSVDGVTWSPDGKSLAVTLRLACPWYCDTAFGVINADGTQLKVFDKAHTCFMSSCAPGEAYIWGAPAWSPDGARVAYTFSEGSECWDERVQCGTRIAVVGISDERVQVLVPGAGLPSWR